MSSQGEVEYKIVFTEDQSPKSRAMAKAYGASSVKKKKSLTRNSNKLSSKKTG